jgi:hypothetical protein
MFLLSPPSGDAVRRPIGPMTTQLAGKMFAEQLRDERSRER